MSLFLELFDHFETWIVLVVLVIAALYQQRLARARSEEAMKRKMIQVVHEIKLQAIKNTHDSGRHNQVERNIQYPIFRENINGLVDALHAKENYASALHATRKSLGKLEYIASAETLEAAKQMHDVCTSWIDGGDPKECIALFYEAQSKFGAGCRNDIGLDPTATSDPDTNRPRRSAPRPPAQYSSEPRPSPMLEKSD